MRRPDIAATGIVPPTDHLPLIFLIWPSLDRGIVVEEGWHESHDEKLDMLLTLYSIV